MDRPSLLFYCQHSLGMGHFVRAMHLVERLNLHFDVTFLNGGPLPGQLTLPPGITLLNLPPLGMGTDSQLIARGTGQNVEGAKAARKAWILDTLDRVRPQVLLIELFPFGRKKFAFELLPLLKRTRVAHPDTRIYCSLRDIMVGGRRDQLRHDNRAAWLINRYFDGVLIHADPSFARLEESFAPDLPVSKPVIYTGFVGPGAPSSNSAARERRWLVSAGGGVVGGELYRTALAAQNSLWNRLGLQLEIVAGPFLPEDEWRDLRSLAETVPGVSLVREVSGLLPKMCRAAGSVSQCGYNTAMDIVAASVPALVVPFSEGSKDEQMNRARRLERLGLVRVLPSAELTPERLASEMSTLLQLPTSVGSLDLQGAERTANWLLLSVQSSTRPGIEAVVSA